MTLYLRTKNNKTISDMELTKDRQNNCVELSVAIDIYTYSVELLKRNDEEIADFIADINFVSEMRGWLWESFLPNNRNKIEEYDNVLKEVRKILHEIASKHGLMVVED